MGTNRRKVSISLQRYYLKHFGSIIGIAAHHCAAVNYLQISKCKAAVG